IYAAMDAVGVERTQPIALFTNPIPFVLGPNKAVNPEWQKWTKGFVGWAREQEDRWSLPTVFSSLDPLNRFGGVSKINDAVEGNVFGAAMDRLCDDLGCPILVAAHLGKDPERGTMGTATFEQNAYFVLDAGETAISLDENRLLRVVRIKDAPSGVGINFHM